MNPQPPLTIGFAGLFLKGQGHTRRFLFGKRHFYVEEIRNIFRGIKVMSSMNSRYKTYNPEKQYFIKHNKNVYMTIGLVRTVS